jgi:hypothetical protein
MWIVHYMRWIMLVSGAQNSRVSLWNATGGDPARLVVTFRR